MVDICTWILFQTYYIFPTYDSARGITSVSYTHLTLPTNREV